MKQILLGVVIGSLFTTGLGIAGDYYNSKGALDVPTGSQQQYDYYRQRQQFSDIAAMREQADRDRINGMMKPCAK